MTFVSLQKRLASIVALGSLGFALLVGMVQFAMEYRAQLKLARELQNQLVATVQASAAVAAFASNPQIAQEVIDGLLMNPTVAAVTLDSLQGFQQERARTGVQLGPMTVYPLYSPVNPKERIGGLSVWKDEAEIDRRAQETARDLAVLMMLQIIVSAGVLMWLFGHMVTRPLAEVAKMLESVTPGSSERLPIPAGNEQNEIGRLVESSNILLGAVEHAIDEERRLLAAVDELDAHYRRIFETTNVGIMILRPSGRLMNCNATLMSRVVGIKFDADSADNCRDFIETIFWVPAEAWAMVWEAYDAGEAVSRDLRMQSTDDKEHWAHCVISVTVGPAGEVEWIEGVLYDVTKRRAQEIEARKAAEHDMLTGLPNRHGMELFIEALIKQTTASNQMFGIMLIDLDGFKAVNDTYGHAAGDVVLKVISERLDGRRRRSRSRDQVARLGGDEFTFIISDIRDQPALLEQIAHDVLELIAQPIKISDDVLVQVGGSIGIARYGLDALNADDLLAAADTAMYAVKQRGKNGFAFAGLQGFVA